MHVLEQHVGFLADRPRVDAFRRAIAATVKPGDVVADLGTGTGVLALMACEAGAARVYGIEQGPVIELARKLAHVNGCADRISFIRSQSRHVQLPEKVDVVLCDLVGEFGYEVGLYDVLADARSRLLKEGGRSIPSAITLYLAPLEHRGLRQQFTFLADRPAGFDMRPLDLHARHTPYHVFPNADALLAKPEAVITHDLPLAHVPRIDAEMTMVATRAGVIDALAGWFVADLAPGVRITNAPDAPDRLDRRLMALPVSPSIHIVPGDEIEVRLSLLTSDHVIRWRVQRTRESGDARCFEGNTLQGLLLSREDLDAVGTQ